jgi:hypothetical protein
VAEALSQAVARNALVMVPTVRLELLWSARSAADLISESHWYDALRQVDLTSEVGRRAAAVQVALARQGHHRGPSPADLLIAATAEAAGAELWHCDRDFELIAEITGQPQRRVGE